LGEIKKTARLIFKAGVKVEVFIEEVCYPATVVEDLGNDLFSVEYNCSENNGESKLCRVTVDHLHVRPSVPQVRVLSFGLLEKVDAFVDFGWLSGVITKKLADSRYIVYFKHTNKEKEVSYLDLRPHIEWINDQQFVPHQVSISNGVEHDELRETVSIKFTNAIGDKSICIDKQTSVVRTSMKRSKLTNLGSNLKPSKKSKADITSDDLGLANGSQSKEVSNPVVGQASNKAEKVYSVKKKIRKREKGVELKRHMITLAKKKGKLSGDSKDTKTLPQGDSSPTTTPNIVERKFGVPIPVIMGLQCYAVTSSKSKKTAQLTSKSPQNVETMTPKQLTSESSQNVETKKTKQLTSKSPHNVETMKRKQLTSKSPQSVETKTPKQLTSKSQNVVEPEEPQSGVSLAPKATCNQEKRETDGDTTTKKRGRPKAKPKTPSAENNENGDVSVKEPYRNVELPLQQDKYDKPIKGKRAKRRMISLNTTSSPPQDAQDSSKQKENGDSETNVEKSLDTVSDNQPLSRWFAEKQALATLESTGKKPTENSKSLSIVSNGDGQSQVLTFEKRSALWGTMESMEVFRLFPQKPHFRPLDNLTESARERHAINKMVDFSSVYEDMRRLRIDHPRVSIEDHLETLSDLETHGFDVSPLRNRLTELISLKDKREALESRSKKVKDNIESQRVVVQKLDKEIKSIDKRLADLKAKRDRALKEKEKKDSEVADLEAEICEIEDRMRDCLCEFDELATTSFD
ncbi:DUF724 domain-containing protein 7-like, partial [Bidens hawaiensis]|uniref:DUF724 domain-containing protein 7-like n=1 Tax=Bidens hawaiensis TaxID=980011 RepID=UPI00404B2B84